MMVIRTRTLWWPTLVLVGVLMAGCGGPIFHSLNLDRGDSVFMDASQRAITNIKVREWPKVGLAIPERILCAEPSPDVARAVASSLGGGLTIFGKGSFNLSQASAEAIAQLGERMATIQLLRDGLYRACEAYANGAISSITYAVIISRIDEVATTLLLGELAAGAFGRQLAAVGTQAEAETKINMIQKLLKKEIKPQPPSEGKQAQPSGPTQTQIGVGKTSTSSESDSPDKVDSEAIVKATVAGLIAGGTITGRAHNEKVAAEVRKIHKQFLGDLGLDTLMVACITALDQKILDSKHPQFPDTKFAKVCQEQIFDNFRNNLIHLLLAEAQAEKETIRANNERVQAETERVKAETKKAYAEAQTECFKKLDKEDAKKVCPALPK